MKIDFILEIFKNPIVIGILTLVSTVAALLAAYFSWKQLLAESFRQESRQARSKPIISLGCSPYCTEDKLIHGTWGVTNRESFSLELLKIEAVSPRTLQIADLDRTTDGPVPRMRPVSLGRAITIEELIPSLPNEFAKTRLANGIGRNFLFRISDYPEGDAGKQVRIRFTLREVDNPHLIQRIEATLVIKELIHYQI